MLMRFSDVQGCLLLAGVAAFSGVVAAVVGILSNVPYALAVGYDLFILLIIGGKLAGRRLGLRSSLWCSPPTLVEWIVFVLLLGVINLTAFTPPRTSASGTPHVTVTNVSSP